VEEDGRSAPSRREWLVAAAVLGLACAALYHASLSNGFVWDDRSVVVENQALRDFSGLRGVFSMDTWVFIDPLRPPQGIFRPVGIVACWIDYRLGGGAPWVFHLHSLLDHALVALLLWRLLRERCSAGAALGLALWFASLPAGVEVVAWASARFDVLGAVLALGALLVHRRGLAGLAAASALTALALFSKEAFVLIPVLLVLDTLSLPAARRWRRVALEAVCLGVVLGGYFWVRARANLAVTSPLAQLDLKVLATDYLSVVGRVLKLLLAPLPLSPVRGYAPLELSSLVVAAGAVVMVGVSSLWWRGARIGGLWFLGTTAMVALVVRSVGFFGDRYAYLPGVAAALFLGGAWGAVEARLQGGIRRGVGVALGLVVLLQGAIVVGRVPDWRDDRSLFSTVLVDDPGNWFAPFELGHVQARAGDWAGAVPWFERALALNPHDPQLLSNAAAAFANTGDLSRALWAGERAVGAAPTSPRARYNYAVALAGVGRLQEAAGQLDAALELAPGYRNAAALRARVAEGIRALSPTSGGGSSRP